MPGKRRKWDEKSMKNAVDAVVKGEMGYFKAARLYEVPQTTLKRYVGLKKSKKTEVQDVQLGRKPALPEEISKKLADYCLEMESRYFGLTKRDVCTFAFDVAKKNGIDVPFNVNKGTAGRKWFKAFMARNKRLSLQTPQATSAARILGFIKKNKDKFFDLYEAEIERLNLGANPTRIYTSQQYDLILLTPSTPKQIKKAAMRGRKRGTSNIITSSPYKKTLEPNEAGPSNSKRAKRNPPTSSKVKKAKKSKNCEQAVMDKDDTACLICCSLFRASKPGEEWVRCVICHKWAHSECVDDGGNDWFVCDLCNETD